MTMPTANAEEPELLPTRRSLLSRLRDLGDDDSWRDFFETYWKLIYRAAVKSGLSDAEAQDVVQETVLTVARTMPRFRYDPALGSFKGWLLKTARWRILDQIRQRDPARPLASLSREVADLPPVNHGNPDLEALWEAEWEQNLMDAALRRIKGRVKPKHYQAFELSALRQWSAPQVAKTLGISVAQVHLVRHRVGNLIKREVKRLHADGV